MKKFIITLIALLILLFIPAESITIAKDPTMASEMFKINHSATILGDAGHFYIPSVELDVPIYYYKEEHQAIVDAEYSAIYRKSFNGGCGYIADHASQGFNKIYQCKIGNYAYIRTEKEIRVFKCIDIIYGYNKKYDLLTYARQYVSNIHWADLCCYTCNDEEGVNITMVFFKEIV